MIKTNHKLDYCIGCESLIVRCATCNNNCCNSGYGRVGGEVWDDNLPICPDCSNAYEVQDKFWIDSSSVEFANVSDKAKEEFKSAWKKNNPKDIFAMIHCIQKVRSYLRIKSENDALESEEQNILEAANQVLKDIGN